VKWLLAIVLTLACGTASAKILTDDNLPEYDVQKECTDAPGAAAGGQAFVARCATSEENAHRAMFGLNVPTDTLISCVKEVERRPPGRNNRDLNMCMRQQSGRAEFKKLETLVPRAAAFCADKPSRDDCIAQEKKSQRFVRDNPMLLTVTGAGDCIDNLRPPETLSWKKVAACATHPPQES
jgi:hypothetical protein